MPEDDPYDGKDDRFNGMASRIVVSRAVFEQLYDPVIEPKIPEALQFRTLSMLRDRRAPLPVGKEKDFADFAVALRLAHTNNLIFDFFAKHADRLFAEPCGGNGRASIHRQSPAGVSGRSPAHDGTHLGFASHLSHSLRNCSERGGKGIRSSIGPHLVLTNWHVIKSMLDKNTGCEAEGSRTKMTFEFDALLRDDGSPGRSFLSSQYRTGWSLRVRRTRTKPPAVAKVGTAHGQTIRTNWRKSWILRLSSWMARPDSSVATTTSTNRLGPSQARLLICSSFARLAGR